MRTYYAPGPGYDQVAGHYTTTRWHEFWLRNEYPLVEKFLSAVDPPALIVDLGCGPGVLLARLAVRGYRVAGVDLSPVMVAQARGRLGSEAAIFVSDIREDLPKSLHRWRAAVCSRVLSHLPDASLPSLAAKLAVSADFGARLVVTDVDARHNYRHTRFDFGRERVSIETHRRTAERAMQLLTQTGQWRVDRLILLRATTASWLPPAGLASIDRSGRRPVSFVAMLISSAGPESRSAPVQLPKGK